MAQTDSFLLGLLGRTPPLAPADTQGVKDWWLVDRASGEEDLASFLVRKEVLTDAAPVLLQLMKEGSVGFSDGARLFRPDGLNRLRAHFGRGRSAAEPTIALRRPSPATPLNLQRPSPQALAERHAGLGKVATAPAASATIPVVGCWLGDCLLTEEVGRGSFGVVFRAKHRALNITVAIKILQPEALENDPASYLRLKSEARLLAQLNHPHIIRLFDFRDEGASPYLIVEYIEGLSLGELIRQCGRLRWDRAVTIAAQIVDGLAAAWKLGIVHRDVKPSNILITRAGVAKLVDLGLAVILTASFRKSDFEGTVGYAAPEQAHDPSAVDHRSDIYALGATLYHAVTGRVPFQGATPWEVMIKHAHEPAIAPHELVPELPVRLSEIILTMMAKDPKERYQDYADLARDLAQLRSKSPARAADVEPVQASPDSRRQQETASLWASLASWFHHRADNR